MPRYDCNLQGQCIAHPYKGNYDTLEECEANCHGLESREALDLAYLTLGYDWDLVRQLTEPEQQEVVFREFGVRIPLERISLVVYFLAKNDIEQLLKDPSRVFVDYVEEQLDDLDYLLLELRELCPSVTTYTYSDYRQQFERQIRKYLREYRNGYYELADLINNITLHSMLDDMGYLQCNNGMYNRVYNKIYDLIEGWMPYLEQNY